MIVFSNHFLRTIIDLQVFQRKYISLFKTCNKGKLGLEEENIIKKELNYTAIKDIKNLFRLEKEAEAIINRTLRDIANRFEHEEEENYYKLVRGSNFWSNNHTEYESNDDRNKTLSVEEYLNKTKPYLKDINNLKKSDTWKTHLTIAINLISSINNDEQRVKHSKSDNIEIMINDETNQVIKERFDSHIQRYRNNQKPMKGSQFVIDYVHLL